MHTTGIPRPSPVDEGTRRRRRPWGLAFLAAPLCVILLGSPTRAFEGVATGVRQSSLSGWTECYRDTYDTTTFFPVVLDHCRKANLMLACRPIGASTLTVAAHAPREDVLFDTARSQVLHVANGVGWYFSEQWSWGFAPATDEVMRNACDTLGSSVDGFAGADPDKRLCWHTEASFLTPGWRCGRADFLNTVTSFERVIFDADQVPPDTARCGNGMIETGEECDGGGLCAGGPTAGQTCLAESDCPGNGVCNDGPKVGTGCAADSDCPRSHCVHCKTFGGRGCAANCTFETDVFFDLVPGMVAGSDLAADTSGTLLLSESAARLPLPFSGATVLTIGKERNGQVPAVVKASSVEISSIEAGNLGCACVRAVDARTCGGTLFEPNGAPSTDCSADFTTGPSLCPANKPCAPLHGPGNAASGFIGCGGLNAVNVNLTQDCNGTIGGPPGGRSIALSGVGGPGSALLLGTFALGTTAACTAESCTDADPPSSRGTPITVPLTTGNVAATVANADDSPGLGIGPLQDNGQPVSCSNLARGKAEGAALVSAFTSCDAPGGQDTAGVTRLVAAPQTPPRCGNGQVDTREECDDGGLCVGGLHSGDACLADDDCGGATEPGVCNGGTKVDAACSTSADCPGADCVRCRPFGGDGCAANCTFETEVSYDLIAGTITAGNLTPGTSGVTTYGEVIAQLPLPLQGTQMLMIGKPRDGEIPMVVKADSVKFSQIPLANFACACIRPVVFKTCGGTLFEVDGVTHSTSCTDGFTEGASRCPAEKPCAALHGPGNSASGVIGCGGLAGINPTTTQDCNADGGIPSDPSFSLSGSGPTGSALLLNSLAIGTQSGPCTPSFCTNTDPPASRGTPITVPFTTGAATALLQNANDFPGLDIGPRAATGAPFSCGALTAALPSAEGGILTGAFTACDQPTLFDVVLTTALAAARPQGPAPTSTPNPTRTATPTQTATPPPAVELRVGQTTIMTGQRGLPIPIVLANAVGVRAVQFTLTDVPDGVVLRASLPCMVASRANALSCSASQVGNEIRVVLLASGSAGIAPGNGQILSLFVDDTAPFCAAGTAMGLNLSATALGDDSGMPLAHAAVNGTLFCDCKGDIDANRSTDIFDALSCIDFILERRTPNSTQRAVADMTCDGTIDIFDCIGIVDVILGVRSPCPLCQ